jgi:hypothetical protein
VFTAACVTSSNNIETKEIIEPSNTPCQLGITRTPSTPMNEVYNYLPSPKLSSVNRSFLPHIIPDSKRSGWTEKTFVFNDTLIYDSDDKTAIILQNIRYEIHISINNSVYYGAKKSSKNLNVFPELSKDDNFNLSYTAMIEDPHQNEMYSDLLHELRHYRDLNHFDDNEYLEFIIRFVQSIPYNETDAHKYPIEVVYENTGVCDDKSKLLAGLLEREGYDVSLFIVSLKNPIGKYQNHMFVGVRSNGLLYNGTNYSLIDTTTDSYPIIPVKFSYIGAPNLGGIKPQVIIIKIGNGTKMYTKAEEVTFIIENENRINDELNYKLNCPSTTSPSIDTLTKLNGFFAIIAPNRNSTFAWSKNHIDLQTIPDKIIVYNWFWSSQKENYPFLESVFFYFQRIRI